MSGLPIDRERNADGPDGVGSNARLTALSGAVLAVLLAALGVTILGIHQMLPAHFLVGFLLIPPLGLKLGSTGYRFMRYYTGSPQYRRAGPPQAFLRFLGPLVVVSTIAVFATGLELWFFGLRFGSIWIEAHKLTFMAWVVITGVHVLAHASRTLDVAAQEFTTRSAGATSRRTLVMGSLIAGVVLALVSLTYASPFIFFGDG